MPKRNFDALNGDRRKKVVEYVPGYDWIPGRFGPPPGIPKDTKDKFDSMTDTEYVDAILKLSQEEKESLMVSEAERRRTFIISWPKEGIVEAHDLAKEGFYYTGIADIVQCAFCGGILRNWERGESTNTQHKKFFGYCKMASNKPCSNIPINSTGLPGNRMTNQLSRPSCSYSFEVPSGACSLNINTIIPEDPALSIFSKRKETYRRYPGSNPVEADTLCEAGFLYEGTGDKVKCFWCDGSLENWEMGDNPWVEHAKWYPGCMFLRQRKGDQFIRDSRRVMTLDELSAAEGLHYRNEGVSFLNEPGIIIPEVPTAKDSGATTQQACQATLHELVDKKGEITMQDSEDLLSKGKCHLCLKNIMPSVVLLPCKHFGLCWQCGENPPDKCPDCGSRVEARMKVILSDVTN